MRRRLVGSMLAIALVCVAMLGVPLAVLARRQVWTSARDRLREQAAGVATGLESRLEAGQPINLHRYLALMPGRRIVVGPAGGTRLVAGPRLSGPVLQATVVAADDTITVQAPEQEAFVRAREVTLVVAGLAVLAMLAAVGLAFGKRGGSAGRSPSSLRGRTRSATGSSRPRRSPAGCRRSTASRGCSSEAPGRSARSSSFSASSPRTPHTSYEPR